MANIPLPDGIITTSVEVTHNIPTFASESLNLIETVAPRGIHRLEGSIDYAFRGYETQKAWTSFLIQMQGRYNTVQIELEGSFASPELSNNPTNQAIIPIGATSFTVGSIDAQIIRAGSMFNFPNDTKVHYALNDATTGQLLRFFPACRRGVATIGTPIEFIAPVITARFTEDAQTVAFGDGIVVETSMTWKEAL